MSIAKFLFISLKTRRRKTFSVQKKSSQYELLKNVYVQVVVNAAQQFFYFSAERKEFHFRNLKTLEL